MPFSWDYPISWIIFTCSHRCTKKEANYGLLNIISSLKLGQVRASYMMKALQCDDRSTSLGQSIAEYGRIFITMYLLRYYSDEDCCQKILVQLNRGESRHNLCRAICYGQNGKVYKKYQQGE